VTAGIEPAEVLQTFRLPPADRLFRRRLLPSTRMTTDWTARMT